ncbi:UDP-N-acetylmuramoyl-tripeptide--D-alanyl-D-alanine ligase [Paenibacillus sp. J2TS4]|nr:UDP-N-acetylmuramoyl-tripeptide--D-alanyl-D-alanine ligase [Paenibacillus sp. J2TS4]
MRIQGVSTDSRSIQPGNLFVPIVGEKYNGHLYVEEAFSRGAAAALWQQDQGEPPAGRPVIQVDDTIAALQRLAQAYRRELPVRIVGITGSNGKTTTKDLTAAILSTTYRVHKTKGNLNNHIGMPITLLQIAEDTEMAVLEMGMSGRGEIELLSRLASPEAVIITNIGDAHLLQLGTREEIARAKTEILSGLRADGFFVYNGDEPLIERIYPEVPHPASMLRYRFGMSESNDIYPTAILQDTDGMHFHINWPESPGYYIPLLGEHNVINSLAAIAVSKYMGVQDKDIIEGLKKLEMSGMRIETVRLASGALLLNDAYNANPAAMKAAIRLLHSLKGHRRKIIVLGDMLELGPEEEEYHREVGRLLDPEEIDELFAFGPLSYYIADEAERTLGTSRVRWFNDRQRLSEELAAFIRPGDAVLFKASRGMKLEEIIQAVQKNNRQT